MSKSKNNIQVQALTKAIESLGQDMDRSYSSFRGLINHKALPNGMLDKITKRENLLDLQNILDTSDFEPFENDLTRFHVMDGNGNPKFDSKHNPIYSSCKLHFALFPEGLNGKDGTFIIQPDGLVIGLNKPDNNQRKGFKTGFPILKESSREYLWDWIFKVKKHCQNWNVYIQSILLWDIDDVDKIGFNIGEPTPDYEQA